MADPLNRGEDYSMLDADGRINPDIERPPVRGFRAHAERVLRRWLSGLGYVWFARDYGGDLLELLNSSCTTAQMVNKSQELRQQALAEPGTTQASVTIRRNEDIVIIEGTISVQGFSYSMRINLNSSDLVVSILGV